MDYVLVSGLESMVTATAAENLKRYLRDVPLNQLAQMYWTNFDMASLLPMEFQVPAYKFLKAAIASQIKSMDWGRIYDAILNNLTHEKQFSAYACFLSKEEINPPASISPKQWYVLNMERVTQRIILQLKGRAKHDRIGSHGAENPLRDSDPRGAGGGDVLPDQKGTADNNGDRARPKQSFLSM